MYISRRTFFGATAAAAARANDRIGVGVIGVGSRGNFLLNELQKCREANFTVAALCDVYRPALQRAADMVKRIWSETPRQTVDYRELLAWKNVDAVVIATPDFSHSRILQDAIKAGKDAFCEKPMATSMTDAKAAYLAVKASDRVVQIGTQRRSEGHYIGAARQVQSGVLGAITRIDIAVNFHEPRWRRDYTHIKEQDVAWPEFLMGRPGAKFECVRSRQKPRSDIDAGMSHAVATCMAAEALARERKVRFDPQKLEIL